MMHVSNEKNLSQNTGQDSYFRPSNSQLPENYTESGGFLVKGDTPVSLVTSGIIEAAAQGFLHVEETEEYKAG